jgi:co-chaperonin GroES (HSP10)
MARFPIKPLFDNVILLQFKNATNKGGFIVQVSDNRPTEGVVLEIGANVTQVKPGDHVIFADYSGQDLPNASMRGDGVPIIIKESEIKGILDPEALREAEEEEKAADAKAKESLAAERSSLIKGLDG